MPHTDSAPNHPSHHLFMPTLQRFTSVITHRRLGLSLVGGVAFVGAATVFNASGAANTYSSAPRNGPTNVQLTVNGQAIPVPTNSSHQTIVSNNGTQTVVDSASSASDMSSTASTATSTFSLHITSSTSSGSETTP